MSQIEIGLDAVAITSPFQKSLNDFDVIDDVKYYRSKKNNEDSFSDGRKPFFQRFFKIFQIFSFYNQINRRIKVEQPDILHAHAMFFCGLPALVLSRNNNIPFVYELRSLWMLEKDKKKKKHLSKSIEYILFKIECFVMKKADSVIVINENLKQVIVNSGINSSKIKIIKNAVNTTLIEKHNNKNINVRETLNFGYIGTLTPHEGIDMLIKSFTKFNIINPKSKLIIYGRGLEENFIKRLSLKAKNVFFKGAINPNEISKAFNEIDVIVNPRYKTKLTDSVTPLKPLEAMAYGKIVIGSNVGGIKELINDKVNGFLFDAGDTESLLKVMNKVSGLSLQEIKKIQTYAKEDVINNKSWLNNAYDYKSLYKSLIIA